MNNNSLPPIISQMIEQLKDKNTPKHIKFNYSQTLQHIKEACEEAINRYKL